MKLNISLDRKPLQQFYHFVEDFDKTLKKGLINAMMFAEGQAKRSFGEPGRLKSRSGRLRGSITSGVDDPLTGWLSTDVVYGCVFGGRTTVVTSEGKKSIAQVKVGDVVLTQNGEFKPVLTTTKFKAIDKPNLVEIITEWRKDRKHKITLTEDHKVLVYRDGRNKWVEAGNLSVDDFMFDLKKIPHNKDTGLYKYCVVCGKKYKPHNKKQWLCSNECKKEWWLQGNNPHIGMKRSDITREKISRKMKERLKNDPKLHPNYIVSRKGYMTKIEKDVRDMLIGNNQEYFFNFNIGNRFVDFYLPSKNLVIEVDGGYWHQDQQKDIERDKYLLDKIPGLKIIHIHYYSKGYTPILNPNPIENVTYSVCNPNINSYVNLDIFKMVKVLSIKKFKYERGFKNGSAYLYDLGIKDVHSFCANTLLISNSVHELGGTIKPKVGKYLKFQIAGQWKTVKQVVIPARPFLRPAIQRSQDNMVEIITRQIMRDFNDNL